MLTRQLLAAVTVCIGLAFGLCPQTQAQEGGNHPTAAQLLQQGIQQFEQGDLEAARAALRRIDPMQLPPDQRYSLYETLQAIDRQTASAAVAEANESAKADAAEKPEAAEAPAPPPPPTPAEMLRLADGLAADAPAESAALYQEVLASAAADDATRATAAARLAAVRRQIDINLTEARRLLDTAAADLKADRLDDAAAKLQRVQQSGARLGWFDEQRLNRQLSIVTERQAQIAAAKAQAEAEAQAQVKAEAEALAAAEAAAQAEAKAAAEAAAQAAAAAEAAAQAQAQAEAEAAAKAVAEAEAAAQAKAVAAAKAAAEAAAQAAAEAEAAALAQAKVEAEAAAKAAAEAEAAAQAQAKAEAEAAAKAAAEAEAAAQAKAVAEAQAAEEAAARAKAAAQAAALAQAQAEAEAAAQAKAQAEAEAAAQAKAEAEAAAQAKAEAEAAAAAQAAAAAASAEVVSVAVEETPVADDMLGKYSVLLAQQRFAEGQQAQKAGQLDLAINHYQQALRLAPDNEQFSVQLAAAQAQRDAGVAPAPLITREADRAQLQRQAALAQYNARLNDARAQLQAGNYPAAISSVEQAKIVLDNSQQLFPTADYRRYRDEAERVGTQVAQTQRQNEASEIARRAADNARLEAAEELRAYRERYEEVQRLLARVVELRMDMEYDEALEVVEQALFIDPNNLAAQALKVGVRDDQLAVESRKLYRDRDLEFAKQRNLSIEASTPYTDLVQYPGNWPDITRTRLNGLDASGADSEVNRQVRRQLRQSVPIDFDAVRLDNVIDYFRNITDVNFFVNWPALELAGVSPDTPVSLSLKNVPAEQALRLVLQQASARSDFDPVSFSIIEGVVTVSTERDLRKTTDTRVYDIRDLLVQVPNFDDAPEFDLQSALESSGSGGGGGGGRSLFDDDNDDEESELPTRAELVAEIISLIQDLVGEPDQWAGYSGPGAVSSLRELNGNLIVKTTPENHNSIVDLLGQLRETRAIQISVEARFLLVDQNFLEEIGVDLDVRIDDVGSHFGPITINQDSVSLAAAETTNLTPSQWVANTAGGLGSSGRGLDIGVSYLDDLQVNLLVQATQASRRAISLTAPRVTFFNGQRAYVIVARQITFISDLEPVPDAVGFDVELEVVNSGVVLDVEGTISADRRYVTLTLQPSLATLLDLRKIEQTAAFDLGEITGDDDDDGPSNILFMTAFVEAPELELTQIKATVSVPDRGTLLLGGQRLVEETEVEAGVPILSKIPFLNRLFTNTSTVKDERTLLILIKPTIIIQSEREADLFPGLEANPDLYNVGSNF